MRRYANASMSQLSAELSAGPVRLRKGYIDAAEDLLQMIQPDGLYPYDFILYRMTGYRPTRFAPPADPMTGQSLRNDLVQVMLDLCDSFALPAGDYEEPAYDTFTLARRFSVSSKTISRWRRRGLPARRLVFPDGQKRLAFLDSSIHRFVAGRPQQIRRSRRFRHLTPEEKQALIDDARRLVATHGCCLNEIARRLAEQTGRAIETIRYTVRRHDAENPDEAVFPDFSAPLDESTKQIVYDRFLHGEQVARLAGDLARTRGSIYRVINEMRAKQLIARPFACVYNDAFDEPDADKLVLADPDARSASDEPATAPKPPPSLPPYLQALYEVPLLSLAQERALFRQYNYLKFKAERLRSQLDLNRVRTSQLRAIEMLLVQANGIKNRIVRANLRLVVSIAKRHVTGPQTLFELISDGNISLMQAVEKFDFALGNRFSTYASWAIMRNYARSVPRERYLLDHFSTGYESVLDVAASLRTYDPNEVNVPELRESIESVLIQLSPRERRILVEHYGLEDGETAQTFDELGRQLGLSKERVRQIEVGALRKLRRILRPQQADLFD